MPARPSPTRRSRSPVSETGVSRGLRASIPLFAILLLGAPVPNVRSLSSCDAPDVRQGLARALETIPALAGRNARLLALEEPRVRGHAGRRPMRACQGRLVTTVGDGEIEYSIHRGDDGALSVRAELFQGGWRPELLERVGS